MSDGKQRSRHGPATGNEVAENAEEDGEEQDRGKGRWETKMILFLDEDLAYLHWVTHHRTGFVLDCLRHSTKAQMVLHRATCPQIKRSESKRTHWTTGKRQKGCSLHES